MSSLGLRSWDGTRVWEKTGTGHSQDGLSGTCYPARAAGSGGIPNPTSLIRDWDSPHLCPTITGTLRNRSCYRFHGDRFVSGSALPAARGCREHVPIRMHLCVRSYRCVGENQIGKEPSKGWGSDEQRRAGRWKEYPSRPKLAPSRAALKRPTTVCQVLPQVLT